MKPDITIIEAVPEDAAALALIKQEIWLDTYVNEELAITAEDVLAKNFLCKERIAKRAEHMGREDGINHTLVARSGTEIVGYGRAVRGAKIDEIVTLYVLPKSQAQGIGTELLKRLLQWLGNDRDVMLGVVPYNIKAIRFYEKFGFNLGKKVYHDKPVFPSGKDLPEVKMLRTVNPN